MVIDLTRDDSDEVSLLFSFPPTLRAVGRPLALARPLSSYRDERHERVSVSLAALLAYHLQDLILDKIRRASSRLRVSPILGFCGVAM